MREKMNREWFETLSEEKKENLKADWEKEIALLISFSPFKDEKEEEQAFYGPFLSRRRSDLLSKAFNDERSEK